MEIKLSGILLRKHRAAGDNMASLRNKFGFPAQGLCKEGGSSGRGVLCGGLSVSEEGGVEVSAGTVEGGPKDTLYVLKYCRTF